MVNSETNIGASAVAQPPQQDEAQDVVLLVGNANVGKSLLFKNLTNRYVIVSNYPGTTVEVVRAQASFNGRNATVIDTPGINDLHPRSDDARVTLGIIQEQPDGTIVQIADAKNLRRSLLLTLQLAELERPMVLVLNMFDELRERGGQIDTERLSEILGIPVVTSVAIDNVGTAEVIDSVSAAHVPNSSAQVSAILLRSADQAENDSADPSVGGDGSSLESTAAPTSTADASLQDDVYEANRTRLDVVKDIMAETYSIAPPDRPTLRTRLGFWAMDPIKGFGFLFAVLLVVFWFVGLFGAGTLVNLLEVAGFDQRLSPIAIRLADFALPFPHEHESELISQSIGIPFSPTHEIEIGTIDKVALRPTYSMAGDVDLGAGRQVLRFIHDLFVGRYGLITMALSYAFAIILPIVTTFFIVFSILEDSGYFPRMAIMLNRTFQKIGLNGKAVLPMILGLGCATMATMTTRILETRKERLITTVLLALAIPCSAQLGVLLAMMATLSLTGAIVWLLIVVGVLLLVGWLSSKAFGGETSEFIMEIPPMRTPQLSNVLVKTGSRIKWYLIEVLPLFVIGTFILFLLDKLKLLDGIARFSEPLVSGWLGLPPETANAFVVGFLRRDFGAVYLLDAVNAPVPLLTPHQVFVAMVTITLFMPCIANVLIIAKEHGSAMAVRMAMFVFPFAFLVGGLVHRLGQWLPL